MMMEITTRYYLSLARVAGWEPVPWYAAINYKDFKNWFQDGGYQFTTGFDFNAQAKELFKNYIWPRFYNEHLCYIDVKHSPWEEEVGPTNEMMKKAARNKLGCIYSWLLESQERYGKLIDLFQAQENNLMKELSSKTTTLFNDTPQSGGDVTVDSYITNATTVNTTADVGTPMARLKEIRDNLENLYNSWADEFRQFIIL